MAPVGVTLKDGQGNTITSFTGTVYLTIAPGANPGGDNLAGNANAVAGVATVSNVMLTKAGRSEEHTSELQSQSNLGWRLLLHKQKYTELTFDAYTHGH